MRCHFSFGTLAGTLNKFVQRNLHIKVGKVIDMISTKNMFALEE